jgi:hypothetical protein
MGCFPISCVSQKKSILYSERYMVINVWMVITNRAGTGTYAYVNNKKHLTRTYNNVTNSALDISPPTSAKVLRFESLLHVSYVWIGRKKNVSQT